VKCKLFVANLLKLDADPAAHSNIGRTKEFFRFGLDQGRLKARRRRNPNGNVAIVVVVIGEHCVDFFRDEKSGFAVRKPLRGSRERGAQAPYSWQMVFARSRKILFWHSCFWRRFFHGAFRDRTGISSNSLLIWLRWATRTPRKRRLESASAQPYRLSPALPRK
jgi:hypothetical protein